MTDWATECKQHVDATCEVCGAKASGIAEALFAEGWDTPPYFTQVTTCPNCPSAPALIRKLQRDESEDS